MEPSRSAPARAWADEFHSPELLQLISDARRGNFDLAAAAARIRQADEHARAAGAALLPAASLDANSTHFRGHSGSASASETDSSAGISASYELDFWGAGRSARDSAALTARARHADRDALELITDTSVASTYFLVVSLRERAASAREDADAARQILAALEARFEAGAVGPQEVAAQRSLVAAADIAPRELEQQELEAKIALALLTGAPPGYLRIEATSLDNVSTPTLETGIPVQLIANRPDVAAAEYELSAAHADLLVARAAFFPSVTLSVSGAFQNPGFNAAVTTLAGTGGSITFAAGLAQTIFDGGRRKAVRNEAQAREDELLATYHGIVQTALGDVEAALGAIHAIDLREPPIRDAALQSQTALDGARMRLRAGSGDILSVLDAQRIVIAAHDRRLVSRLERLQAVVSLAKALGGGWRS